MKKMSEWDKLNAIYNRYYNGQMSGIEEDGLYVNRRFGWAKFDTDNMSDEQIAALSGECKTVVKAYELVVNT